MAKNMVSDARTCLFKNQQLAVIVDDFNNLGQGVAHHLGIAIFISGALPGEKVLLKLIKVKKNYAIGKLLKVIDKAKERQTPCCANYPKCGGCQLQHLSYALSLRFKQEQVQASLRTITKLTETELKNLVQPTLAAPKIWGYRSKVVYNFAFNPPRIGFYEPQSHRVIEAGICPIEPAVTAYLRHSLQQLLLQDSVSKRAQELGFEQLFYDEANQSGLFKRLLLRLSQAEQTLLAVWVLNYAVEALNTAQREFLADLGAKWRGSLNLAAYRAWYEAIYWPFYKRLKVREVKETETDLAANADLAIDAAFKMPNLEVCPQLVSLSLNFQKHLCNKILSDAFLPLTEQTTITEQLEVAGQKLAYTIGAADFFQVNPTCTACLFDKVLAFLELQGHELVYDLYCGAGSISLALAKRARKVIGIEIVESAILHAQANARLNGMANLEFYAGDCADIFPKLYANGEKADAIVVDPPRKGLDEQTLQTILKMQPKKLVYVSCHPGSLARDLACLLQARQYRLVLVQPVDMFPWTPHVETVVLLERKL